MIQPRYIDNTILSAWKRCRLSAWLTYGQGRKATGSGYMSSGADPSTPAKPNLKLLFGTAFHEAVAIWHTTRNATHAALQFETLYRDACQQADDDRYAWGNAKDILAAWLYHQQAIPQTFTPLQAWVENHLEVPLTDDGGIVFVSRPDALGTVTGRSGYYTMETKTTGQRLGDDWASQWAKSSQLTSQIWAVARATNQLPAGALVNAVEVKRLPTDTKRCKTHGMPYTECRLSHASFNVYGPYIRGSEALETWRRDAIQLATDYFAWVDGVGLEHAALLPEDGAFDAGGACRFCDWRTWCSSGKQLGALPSVSIVDRWDPRVGAKGQPRQAGQAGQAGQPTSTSQPVQAPSVAAFQAWAKEKETL